MRIGIFTDTYLPDINGVATSSGILQHALMKQGHEVTVVTTEVKKGDSYTDDGDVLRMTGIELKNIYGYRLAGIYSSRIMKILREKKLDVIHIQTEFSIGIFGKIAAHLLNIPVVYTYHTQYEDYTHYAPVIGQFESTQPFLKKAVSIISQIYGDNCTALIVPSQKTAEILKGYGIDKDMHIIPTGLELDRFDHIDPGILADVKAECGIADDHFTLLFLGRIAPEKSVDVIISAVSHLDIPGLRLVIVGDGPAVPDLKAQCEKLHVEDKVKFVGAKEADRVPYYYHAADLFVSASVTETQGLTYIEAMACRKCVLARYDKNLDGIIQDGVNGFFFTDEQSLEEKISQLSRMDLSAVAQKAYEDSRQYSASAFAEKVVQVYEQAIKEKHFTYKIEKISPRPNNMCEVVLEIDNQEVFIRLPEHYILDHHLAAGQVIEHDEFAAMQEYEMVYKGYKKALRYLTYRDYTKKEMTDKLAKTEEFSPSQIAAVISLLEDHHLIDDREYADNFMNRANRTGMGINKALKKLAGMGIDEAILDELKASHSRELELEKAEALIRKEVEGNHSKSQAALRQAITDKLYYQGFDQDIIQEAMAQVPFEVSAQNEKAILISEFDKIKKRYEKRFSGRDLEVRITQYLNRKGFTFEKIREVMKERDDQDDS